MSKIGDIVLPGDIIDQLKCQNGALILGPGLKKHTGQDTVLVTRSGEFCHKQPNVYWVESLQKRYVPKKGELVVGIVTAKRGDGLKVDIGSGEHASLLIFAFEGVTKKQKPDVQIGDIVYARLLSATREMEPELVCIDSYDKAGRLGILSDEGFVFSVNQKFAYKLLNYDYPLLKCLGKKVPYEIAVGMNGRVWINARDVKDINVVFRALKAAENQTDHDVQLICNRK